MKTAALALRVIVLTPEVHKYLTRHKPEALTNATAALRENLPADEWQRVQTLLAALERQSGQPFTTKRKTKQLPAPEAIPTPEAIRNRARQEAAREAEAIRSKAEQEAAAIREQAEQEAATQAAEQKVLSTFLRPSQVKQFMDGQVDDTPKIKLKPGRKRVHPEVDPAIIELLQDAQGEKPITKFAKQIGVKYEHIRAIYQGKSKPSEKVMRFLNIY